MKASRTQFGTVVTASKKLVAGIFAAAALSLAAAAAEEQGTHFVPPKGTSNVAVATVARPGAVKKTVAFLGGSITEMAGFRPHVMKALRAKYPQVDFVEIAAGLASTCSDAGAFRLEEDVLSRGVPDLFIVEAAVNDCQDGHFTQEHSIRGMEGTVRHVLARNPSCAVVVALMVNRSQYRTLMEGGTPEHYVAHAKVAKHYGAALADVGSALRRHHQGRRRLPEHRIYLDRPLTIQLRTGRDAHRSRV